VLADEMFNTAVITIEPQLIKQLAQRMVAVVHIHTPLMAYQLHSYQMHSYLLQYRPAGIIYQQLNPRRL
jgi:hypothetical protein